MIILSSLPDFGRVATEALFGMSCGSCGAEEAKLKCSRCKAQRYCSRECQQAHWKAHKPLCGVRIEPFEAPPGPVVPLVRRFVEVPTPVHPYAKRRARECQACQACEIAFQVETEAVWGSQTRCPRDKFAFRGDLEGSGGAR